MTLKQKVYQHYLQFVNGKISLLQQILADLKESGANETKVLQAINTKLLWRCCKIEPQINWNN
jgi:hypothetical protein